MTLVAVQARKYGARSSEQARVVGLHMASSSEVEADLAALADHLAAHREPILTSMRKAVSEDPRLAVAAKLPRAQFQDHLPQLLGAFEARLRARTQREELKAADREVENAEQHGRHRWHQGYNLGETILEWRHLHECLLREIERFIDLKTMSMPAMRLAMRDLATLLGEGVSESAQEHALLHQLESQARAAELSQALERARAIEAASSHTWREALHDLRGSMGLVRNASAVLVRDALPENARAQSKDILKRGVAAVAELLEELTDLARLESGQERVNITSFDAADVLSRLCTTTRPLAATQGLFLHTEGPEELMVSGDAMKVHRIAQNLLLNAIKYTQQGGVWVRWKSLETASKSGALGADDSRLRSGYDHRGIARRGWLSVARFHGRGAQRRLRSTHRPATVRPPGCRR